MIIPMLCVTIFVILVVWFLLPRVARLMIHTPRSEERFSRNAETDLVCRLLLEKKNAPRLRNDEMAPGERPHQVDRSHEGLSLLGLLFFFNDPATTENYTLSLHDALPI